jgi:tetratricopeptide (TPR) repeat protein
MNLARRQTMKQSTRWLRSFAPRWKFLLALLVFIAGFGIWRGFFYRSQVERGLIALNKAYKNERPLEVRVTGMSYAPHSDKRGSEQQTVDDRARNLSGELLLTAASNDLNASSLHALGRYYLLQKEFDKAIRQFQEALKSSPDAAQLHADLGAALLEKAKLFRDGREPGKAMEHLAESYEQLSSALKVNPSLAEASFNRALVLKEMMLPEQTRKAWQKYLELDPQSRLV